MHTKYAPPLHTAGEIEKLAARCREERMIAVDTEFIRESTFFPVVALVQVATRDQSWFTFYGPEGFENSAFCAV